MFDGLLKKEGFKEKKINVECTMKESRIGDDGPCHMYNREGCSRKTPLMTALQELTNRHRTSLRITLIPLKGQHAQQSPRITPNMNNPISNRPMAASANQTMTSLRRILTLREERSMLRESKE
jgi:hypothetical protein